MEKYALKDYSDQNINDLKLYLAESWKGLMNEIAEEKAQECIDELGKIVFARDDNIIVSFDLKLSAYTILSKLGISKMRNLKTYKNPVMECFFT